MSLSLNVIYPAGSFVEGGTPTAVDLFCINEAGKRVNKQFSKVFLKIIISPFSVEEVTGLDIGDQWDVNVFYATKIVNPCDDSVVYVANYINDITAKLNCCTSSSNPTEEDVWIDSDNQPVIDSDLVTILYQ